MIKTNLYKSLRNIPISGSELVAVVGAEYQNRAYRSPRNKLVDLEKRGVIIRLKKGLYVVNATDYGFPPSAPICSNHIYGPSYLSGQWALSYYGLIPERVNVYTAMTIKRGRNFENSLGLFTYYHVDRSYFGVGLKNVTIDGTQCLIASAEKALVDFIQFDNLVPCQSVRALGIYLEEDIRLDMDALKTMDISILQQCTEYGHKKKIIQNLIKLIQKL